VSVALPCPFDGATPLQGLTKVRHCQMHGDPFQSWFIRCPHGCAQVDAADQPRAIALWNRRASPVASQPLQGWHIVGKVSSDGRRFQELNVEFDVPKCEHCNNARGFYAITGGGQVWVRCTHCGAPSTAVASPESVSIPREVAERALKAVEFCRDHPSTTGTGLKVASNDAFALRTALQGREKT
jgi:hypothetical protein